jgi:hypothetical protein
MFPDFDHLEEYEPGEYPRDYHSVVTIQLCELIEGGWVKWLNEDGTPNPDWAWDFYDEEQYSRLCKKFDERFFWDEISMLPPLRWKQQLIRKLNEIMPKYKLLYKALAAGVDPLQETNKYGKSRNIFSEFPETLLNGNSDYVSNGTDREYEDIEQGDWIAKSLQIAKEYNDVDVLILDELESMFSGLYTVSMNGW